MKLLNALRNHSILVKNTGYLTAIEAMRMLLPFVALPYVISVIGEHNYGSVAFAQTVVTFFAIFINFGLDVSSVKPVAENRDNPEILSKIVSTVLATKTILLAIAAILYAVCIAFLPLFRTEALLFSFAFLTCISEILFPVWFYQGIEKMKYLTIVRFISIAFYTATVFLVVKEPEDYPYVALLQSIGAILSGIVSVYMLLKVEGIRFRWPKAKEIKDCIKEAVPFFTSRISVVISNGLAKLMSGLCLSMEAVGAFDLAQKMATAAFTPVSMMCQSVYPHIAKNKSLPFVRKYYWLMVFASAGVALVLVLLSPYAIEFFAKNKFPDTLSLTWILSLWIFFAGQTSYVGVGALISFGHPKPFNMSVIVSTLFMCALYGMAFIFDALSVYAFAWILVASESVLLIYRVYFCRKYKTL